MEMPIRCPENFSSCFFEGHLIFISEWAHKAIIVKPNDEGTSEKPFGHTLIASIDRYLRTVTKRMSKKKVKQRSKIKYFFKYSLRSSTITIRPLDTASTLLWTKTSCTKKSSRIPWRKRRLFILSTPNSKSDTRREEQRVLLKVEILNFPYSYKPSSLA